MKSITGHTHSCLRASLRECPFQAGLRISNSLVRKGGLMGQAADKSRWTRSD